MADSIVKTRSNYFVSSDPAALKALVASLKTDRNAAVFGEAGGKCMFYCDGEIEGVLTPAAMEHMRTDPDWADDNPDQAYSHELFLETLQALVAPGEACVIKAIGHEAMRDLWADAYVITRTAIRRVDLDGKAARTAAMMRHVPPVPFRIALREVTAEQDPCSCHSCGLKNHGEGAVRVFDLKFSTTALRFCEHCAGGLYELLEERLGI